VLIKQKVITAVSVFSIILAAGCSNTKTISYPKKGKTITVICPWEKGGGTDTLLRAITAAAQLQLGTDITVTNNAGDGGAAGFKALKNAQPDGYTLGMITFELNALPQQKAVDFTYKDFDPLIRVNADSAAITVRADSPYKTLQQFVEYAKTHPGEIAIGDSSPGSVWNIGALIFAKTAGIVIKHVPFDGAAATTGALAAGTVQAVSVSLAEVKSQIDEGKAKCLGLMDEQRSKLYPSIPTLREEGFDVTCYTWRGLALPRGTDPQIIQILSKAFTKAMDDPDFKAAADKLNFNLAYLPPDEFSRFLAENYDEVTKALEETHLIER